MNLTELSRNQKATIKDIIGAPETVVRLAELGFTHGEPIRIVGKSLFKSPYYIEIRGAVMALRKSEAECIQVQL